MRYRTGGAMLVAALSCGCAAVTGVGARGTDTRDPVRHVDVVSLLPLHPTADARLVADTSKFGEILAQSLRRAGFDTRNVDVPELVHRHDLPVDVVVRHDGSRRQVDGVLPEKALLSLVGGEGRHRLLLFPSRLVADRRTGVTLGRVDWRLESSAGDGALAKGVLRYVADARGFPGRRLAGELVAELDRLGVQGDEGALD